MSDVDISVLGEYFCSQFERLQTAKQDKDASKLKKEIFRTREVIKVSRRIILNAYIVNKLTSA